MALEESGLELQFVVEWFDPLPQLKKQFLLKYFVKENMAELYDIKNRVRFSLFCRIYVSISCLYILCPLLFVICLLSRSNNLKHT